MDSTLPEEPPPDSDAEEGPFFDLQFTSGDHIPNPHHSKQDNNNNNNKHSQPDQTQQQQQQQQLSNSLLKSATKFRVFILSLTKPSKSHPHSSPNKLCFVKLNLEEETPNIASLFTRDTSSRCNSPEEQPGKSNKEVVHKYLSKIKPLYVRVSRKYGDKLKFSGPLVHDDDDDLGLQEVDQVVEKGVKLAMPAKLRVVYERLGKSRSASVAAAAVTSPQRRDDSLLQQQDGIQSAIAHCKRSFTATSKDASFLRSNSDPGTDAL